MSTNEVNDITVNILNRSFKIKCPKNKISELQQAASLLDKKMQDIHRGDKLIPTDRVAIIAALNLAHDLINHKHSEGSVSSSIRERIQNLSAKIEEALRNANVQEKESIQ